MIFDDSHQPGDEPDEKIASGVGAAVVVALWTVALAGFTAWAFWAGGEG